MSVTTIVCIYFPLLLTYLFKDTHSYVRRYDVSKRDYAKKKTF